MLEVSCGKTDQDKVPTFFLEHMWFTKNLGTAPQPVLGVPSFTWSALSFLKDAGNISRFLEF